MNNIFHFFIVPLQKIYSNKKMKKLQQLTDACLTALLQVSAGFASNACLKVETCTNDKVGTNPKINNINK
jgi:hypothetical protein